MLQMSNQNMNFNGTSILDDAVVMEMSASTDRNSIWMNITVNDIDAYLADQVDVDVDLLEFKDIVISSIRKILQ